MKLLVENLGRIRRAEIELKPLTVFIGKNGTQKTWTAHAYFALLAQLRFAGRGRSKPPPLPLQDRIDSVVKLWREQIAAAPSSEVSLNISRAKLLESLPATLSTHIFGLAFGSAIGIQLPRDAAAELVVEKERFEVGVGERLDVMVSADRRRIVKVLHLGNRREPWSTTSYPSDEVACAGELAVALGELGTAWRYQVRALPAERVHLVQAFSLLLQQREFPMPRALVDFCYMMSTAASVGSAGPEGGLAAALVKATGGAFSFADGQLLFRSVIDGKLGDVLPIKATGSLAKSVAGLSVFLANAGRGDAVVIDEPEMNAHPEAQVALVELFGMMVRAGMHVVVLTHSAYVVEHISALVAASRVEPEDRRTLLGSGEAYLTEEEVAVYDFEGENVRDVFDRATGGSGGRRLRMGALGG